MQNESLLLFSFPRQSNFGEAKVTKSREQNKINLFIFYAECIITYLKLIKIIELSQVKVTMFALANALTKSGNALWRFRTSSRKANHCGVFHSFLSKKLVR